MIESIHISKPVSGRVANLIKEALAEKLNIAPFNMADSSFAERVSAQIQSESPRLSREDFSAFLVEKIEQAKQGNGRLTIRAENYSIDYLSNLRATIRNDENLWQPILNSAGVASAGR